MEDNLYIENGGYLWVARRTGNTVHLDVVVVSDLAELK